ncbi:MAG: hypothetical protein IJ801_05890 [Lachnospiraceae bacterium]|nr:hypothetical protein [Lachnospiraceae bacterium]
MKSFKNYLRLVTIASVFCMAMTGCGNAASTRGNNDNTTTSESVAENVGDAAKDVAEGVGDAAKNVTNGVGDAAKNVTNGVGDAVDDLLGNGGFNNYADAHDYFLDTMGAYHSDANFELRNEDKNLTDYQEGSKGYHFTLYDTSKNAEGDLFGEFYVDATSGVIYKKGNNNTFEEYPANTTTSNRKTRNGTLSDNR